MSTLQGMRAVVTGGSSGIGADVVRLLVGDGASACVLDRDRANPGTHGVRYLTCDVTDDPSVQAAISQSADIMGGIDILINNAGIGAQGDIAANGDEEWRAVFDVNVVGMARVTRAALPHLRRSAAASIVNTSSVVANIGVPNRALYAATKGAVQSLTFAMAADHIGDGIRVNCVTPGTTDTPWVGRLLAAAGDAERERAALTARQPLGRLVAPTEVAQAILYLAGPASASTTGTSLAVDGGMSSLRLPAR